MERKNKKELLGIIDDQQKQLQLYKKRLHDVVESCKNLMKEKQALEESVKVLTQPTVTEDNANAIPSDSESDDAAAAKNEPAAVHEEENHDLKMLKSSLRTLTLEKTRIENELKSDRKRLLKENEDLQKQLSDRQQEWCEQRAKLENSIKELRKQIRDQQIDRDREQQNHSIMLKELQGLVSDERCAKEKLEIQLENLKLALEKLPDKRLDYERRIDELRNELQSTRALLEAAEGEKKDLPSLLQQLQQEMNEMKGRHQGAVDREIKRANEAEMKLKALASVSEERSASLEQRLSELSQMVGSYDKLRQQDQIAIQKLKERVAQLDQENTVLARTVTNPERNIDFDSDMHFDTQAVMEQIKKLKGYLQAANQKSRKLIISGILSEIQKDDDNNIHAACQNEIKLLREELERCRLNEEFVKSQHEVEAETSTKLSTLKKQVSNLQNELQIHKAQHKSMAEQLQASEQNFSSYIKEVTARHKHELNSKHSEYQIKLLELELQLQKQRERSMMLIEDKDKEIAILKMQLEKHSSGSQAKEDAASGYSELSCNDPVTDLISTSKNSNKKGKQILHYAQELCRKDVEITNLRRSKLQAESSLRELQQISAVHDEAYKNEIDALKSQINRLESIQKGINMEYLKNVVLRFIKCSKKSDQSHMLNAIASILHFTAVELEEAKDYMHLF